VSGLKYPATLNHESYGSEELVIFYDASVRDPILTLSDYEQARHAVVSFGGTKKSEIGKALTNLGLQRQVSLVAPDVAALAHLIEGTDVIATMPRRLSNASYSGLKMCVPPVKIPDLQYELVWHRRYEHSGRNIWLRNLLKQASAHFYGNAKQLAAT